MIPADVRNLFAQLEQVPDPRGCQGLRHPLSAMLAAVVCAMLCGARGFRHHRSGFTSKRLESPTPPHQTRQTKPLSSPAICRQIVDR